MRYDFDLPVSTEDLMKLKTGDLIYITGLIITARDLAHKRILEYKKENKNYPESFEKIKNTAIYHCGPIIKKDDSNYKIVSAGPTTSARMDAVENEAARILDIHIIIGKGGMKNLDVKNQKIVYLAYPGGCGAIASKMILGVEHVEWLDLGSSEAMWFLKVKDFGPLIVTQDTTGKSAYK